MCWTGRKWGRARSGPASWGREVVGQCMYRGTVDGVEDNGEDGLLVIASYFVLFILRLSQTTDNGTVL